MKVEQGGDFKADFLAFGIITLSFVASIIKKCLGGRMNVKN